MMQCFQPSERQTRVGHDYSRIAQLSQYLSEIARGGEPFGTFPQGIVRRAHSTPGTIAGADTPVVLSPPPPWPDLPMAANRTLPGVQVGKILLLLLGDEEIAGSGKAAGLTPDRLRRLLQAAGLDASMTGRVLPALALWLAQAGILAAPDNTVSPWAAPRQLTTTDADAVAAQLRTTPPPTPEAVTTERGRGLK